MKDAKLMFNEMNMLIALTIDTLPHSSSPVIGSVINFLQPGKFSLCNHEQHKILWYERYTMQVYIN